MSKQSKTDAFKVIYNFSCLAGVAPTTTQPVFFQPGSVSRIFGRRTLEVMRPRQSAGDPEGGQM